MEQREKIAILGGGMASLVTAFSLTEQPDWQHHYDITVYQMGWRLGGKGASSRNAHAHHRIEEHGLHIFYGFYENTFRMIRRCYEELGRKPYEPLATWKQAFTPHNFIALQEQIGDEWLPWYLPFPPNSKEPGDDAPLPNLWQCLSQLLEYAAGVFDYWHFGVMPEISQSFTDALRKHTGTLFRQCLQIWAESDRRSQDRIIQILQCVALRVMQSTLHGLAHPETAPSPINTVFLHLARLLLESLQDHPSKSTLQLSSLLVRFLRNQRTQRHKIDRNIHQDTQKLRRMLICEDLFLTAMIGLVEDGLVEEHIDWRKLDGEDLKDWLRRHGAHPTTVNSTLINSLYDAAFSRDFGVAAGTMLHAIMRMFCTYKGAFMWKMNAGMGETIFAPLYLVLQRRGVKFRFFHRVDHLDISESDSGKRIERVTLGRQATLCTPDQEYHPLVDINGLPCWPSEPNYSQLQQGPELCAQQINLENAWTSWPDPVEPLILEADKDYDHLVLGISIAALPWCCQALIQDNPQFAAMLDHVKTTQTQAVQLWFQPTLSDKGWSAPSPVLIQFADPFDTWADMTHLLPIEKSPPQHPVGSIAYLCSRLQDRDPFPPPGAHDYPQQQQERVKQHALAWLCQHSSLLWPNLPQPQLWDALVDPQQRCHEQRFQAQYWHAPVHPSDRYVLAPAGSTRYRLRTDQSGYHNLFLTGDWTLTSMNLGCVEAATMSGLATYRAISRQSVDIYGDWLALLTST